MIPYVPVPYTLNPNVLLHSHCACPPRHLSRTVPEIYLPTFFRRSLSLSFSMAQVFPATVADRSKILEKPPNEDARGVLNILSGRTATYLPASGAVFAPQNIRQIVSYYVYPS